MLVQIRVPFLHGLYGHGALVTDIGIAVHHERSCRNDYHRAVRRKARLSADYVHELLRTQVCREPGLRHSIVPQLHGGPCRNYAVGSVGYISERESVNEHGLPFQGLYQVRVDSVLEEDHHRPYAVQLLRGDRATVVCVPYDYPLQPFPEVLSVGGKRKNCGYLRCGCDQESALMGHTSDRFASKAHDRVPELSAVHVDGFPQCYLCRVYAQLVAFGYVVLRHCRQQIVGTANRVYVSCEMKVYVPHRIDLRESSSCGTPLYTEYRTYGRLPEGSHHFLAYTAEPLNKTYRSDGLPFACRRCRYRRNEDQLPVLLVTEALQHVEGDLGHIPAVRYQLARRDPHPLGQFCNGPDLGLPRYVQIRFHIMGTRKR